jgi:hypothetical protein
MSSALPDQLDHIIATCYAASMQKEESRPTRFRVVCSSPDIVEILDSSDEVDVLPFREKVPLTSHSIRKLAAGMEIPDTALWVWTESGKTLIFGLLRITRARWGVTTPHDKWSHKTRNALSISATSPGMLVFDNLEGIVGEFANGKFEATWDLEGVSLLASRLNGMSDMAFAVATEELWMTIMSREEEKQLLAAQNPAELPKRLRGMIRHSSAYNRWRQYYVFVLKMLLRAVQRHGCGGTLVISTNSSLECGLKALGNVCEGKTSRGRKADGATVLRDWMFTYYEDLVKADPRYLAFHHNEHFMWDQKARAHDLKSTLPPTDEYSEFKSLAFQCVCQVDSKHRAFAELAHAARLVGKLSAADGATILLPDFSVYSFGAKFADSKFEKSRAKVYANSESDTPDLSTIDSQRSYMSVLPTYDKERGMRFWSAVSYVDKVKDAIAFVSSVDGTLTACMRLGDGVLIIEPISLEMEHVFTMSSNEASTSNEADIELIDANPETS